MYSLYPHCDYVVPKFKWLHYAIHVLHRPLFDGCTPTFHKRNHHSRSNSVEISQI